MTVTTKTPAEIVAERAARKAARGTVENFLTQDHPYGSDEQRFQRVVEEYVGAPKALAAEMTKLQRDMAVSPVHAMRWTTLFGAAAEVDIWREVSTVFDLGGALEDLIEPARRRVMQDAEGVSSQSTSATGTLMDRNMTSAWARLVRIASGS